MRSVKVFLVMAVVVLFAVPACAHHRGAQVEVEIVPDKGELFATVPFKKYYSGTTRIIKKYLEARKGEHYSILIRNTIAERIGIVVAVDGRNIISGKKSYLGNNEAMYIVGPYEEVKLEGWRTDQDTVHKFYFTDIQDSYSVRTFGDTSAMGVITVAVFREKERPVIFHDRTLRKKAPAAPSSGESSARAGKYQEDSAGTGFGDRRHSPAVKVEFEPERIPAEKIFVKYEWRHVLCGKGLLICGQEDRNRLWDEHGYAPFPPGYRDSR